MILRAKQTVNWDKMYQNQSKSPFTNDI